MGRINFSDAISHFNKWAPRIILTLLAAMVITGLGSAILTAYFGVPIGDDYLAIKTFSDKHTWLSEAWNSLTHTSRYMQSITSSLAYGLFRSKVAVLLPLIVMIWFYMLIFLYVRLASNRTKIQITNTGNFVISAAILFLLLNFGRPSDMHNIWLFFQPYFFTSAIVTYTIGILLYLTFILFMLSSKKALRLPPFKYLSIIFVGTFLLSLYNETMPATLLGLSALGALVSFAKSRKTTKIFYALLVTGASTLLALMVMFLSPANAARRQTVGAKMSFSDLYTGVSHNLSSALSSFILRPSDIVTAVAIATVAYFMLAPKGKLKLGVKVVVPTLVVGASSIAAGLLSLIASLTLSAIGYGVSPNIYPRTLLLPEIFLITGLIITTLGVWAIIDTKVRKQYLTAAVMSVIMVATLFTTPHSISRTASHLVGVQDYNAVWQKQDQELKEQAKTDPQDTVYIEDEGAGIGDGFSVRCVGPYVKYTSWLSDGMEAYYGVKRICATSDEGK